MSNNYKVVKVDYSLEEYGISNIDVVNSEFGVDEVKIIDEENDIGVLSYEDESILLVIGDKSEWYNKVEQFNLDSIEKEVDFSNGDYNEEDWDGWVELVEELV